MKYKIRQANLNHVNRILNTKCFNGAAIISQLFMTKVIRFPKFERNEVIVSLSRTMVISGQFFINAIPYESKAG